MDRVTTCRVACGDKPTIYRQTLQFLPEPCQSGEELCLRFSRSSSYLSYFCRRWRANRTSA